MAIEYNFTLDMDRSKRDNNIAYARTGDVDSITINADLVLNGTAYTPTGTNAFFECVTPNGHSIRAAAEKTGSTVSVEVPSAAFQAAGVINVAYFRFESGASDNPTYVESTEPFAIVVREGIGDNIDAGDYIEEWRQLVDHLEAVVAEVEQKAEQAETAINEQKTEVDQLKAQAQKAIAGDVTEVEETAQSAIAAINKEKADVADAAEDVSAAGEQAINTFKTNSQQAINQFNTNADSKLEEVDGMITEAQGDVDAAITQLEDKTQEAIDAAQDALDGTTATNLQNAINRTLKLDVADMTVIQDNSSLSSFTNVGSYCCKTAATAATIGDCPVDDSPFNMYVFSSATSGQVMQLVVPIDLNGKPTAEWHVRFGTSSAMDKWSVIGGGADIAAGLGIDITGDAEKTVALDTTAFYQHHEATDVIQGSTEVTGGGRFKELVVYGNTRQNLWVNPDTRTIGGITLTANADGSITVSGTATTSANIHSGAVYSLRPGGSYYISTDRDLDGFWLGVSEYLADGSFKTTKWLLTGTGNSIVIDSDVASFTCVITAQPGATVSGTYRVMLNEGEEAEPWCPPGLNSVEELSLVTAGKNLIAASQDFDNLRPFNSVLDDVGDGWVHVKPSSAVNGGVLLQSKSQRFIGGETYTLSFDARVDSGTNNIDYNYLMSVMLDGTNLAISAIDTASDLVATEVDKRLYVTFVVPDTAMNDGYIMIGAINIGAGFYVRNVQLELGSTATAYEPPVVTTTPIDLDGHALNSLPDGTRDELRIDGTGAVTLVQRVGVATAPTEMALWSFAPSLTRAYFNVTDLAIEVITEENGWCDKLPMFSTEADVTDPIYATVGNYKAYARHPSITDTSTAATIAGGATYLYKLAAPQEVDLPGITMPDLASPSYTVFASSNVPAEIEAEVVKVDYLPPSDVYTKAEVDKKIEDAGGMPEVVPVSKGGTGVTTAAAERNRLGLGNTTGALPVANGGTGAATAKAAEYNILGGMITDGSDPEDTSNFAMVRGEPSSAGGVLFKCKGTSVWNWIASKIRSTFGFNASNVLTVAKGGTGSTSAKAAQNSLLNDMNVSSDALTDSSMLVGYNASPSASNGAVHKRSVSTVWDYVAGKIRSTFGFSSSNVLPVSHGGTGITDNPSMLVNLGSASASNVLSSSPRPGVTGTLPVSHGGTGATAPGVDMLKNLGITFGTADPPSSGTPGSIYIQYFK